MSFDQHANFAYSTIATAPSPASSGTSLVVHAGDGGLFPAAPFNVIIWPFGAIPNVANSEIVRVTNVSADTFTIARDQEGTSPRSVVVGDQIALTITKKNITDIEMAILDNARDVKLYGALVDGSTDDSTAVQTALNAGGRVIVSGGTCCIASTITLPQDAVLEIMPGATIKWTGSAAGSMFTTTTANPTRRTGVIGGGMIDPQNAGVVFDLHSPQESIFGVARVLDGTATMIVMKLYADVTANTGGVEGSYNAVYNRISINCGTCGDVLDLNGASSSKVVTLNDFPFIMCGDVRVKGIRHIQWADNNYFGSVRLNLTANNAQGVIVNDSATPAANVGVYGNHYTALAIDTFAGPTGRKALVLNWSQQTRISNFYQDPAAEGGAIVNNNSQNHIIGSNTAGGFAEEIEPGTVHRAASGSHGFKVDDTYAFFAFTDAGATIFWCRSDGNSFFGGPLGTNKIYDGTLTNQLIDSVRKTGWTAPTGTPSRATYATSSVTLPTLAGVVMALIQDLESHGLIGP